MTDIVPHATSHELAADMEYARVVSSGAMLPAQYRGKPADILIAIGLGRAMGLSPAESLYRIHVIQGRPCAAAELIAANVRKAGHTLRVRGDESTARAVITRNDDPEFEFESVWNLDRAKRLGLSDKDGWKKQPGTMMRWRAITEVARLACPEALYGVAYVKEELDDEPREHVATTSASAADFLPKQDQPVADLTDAEVVEDEPTDPMADPDRAAPKPVTPAQLKALHASFSAIGLEDRDKRLEYASRLVGRPLASSKDLTSREARMVIDAAKADEAGQ